MIRCVVVLCFTYFSSSETQSQVKSTLLGVESMENKFNTKSQSLQLQEIIPSQISAINSSGGADLSDEAADIVPCKSPIRTRATFVERCAQEQMISLKTELAKQSDLFIEYRNQMEEWKKNMTQKYNTLEGDVKEVLTFLSSIIEGKSLAAVLPNASSISTSCMTPTGNIYMHVFTTASSLNLCIPNSFSFFACEIFEGGNLVDESATNNSSVQSMITFWHNWENFH